MHNLTYSPDPFINALLSPTDDNYIQLKKTYEQNEWDELFNSFFEDKFIYPLLIEALHQNNDVEKRWALIKDGLSNNSTVDAFEKQLFNQKTWTWRNNSELLITLLSNHAVLIIKIINKLSNDMLTAVYPQLLFNIADDKTQAKELINLIDQLLKNKILYFLAIDSKFYHSLLNNLSDEDILDVFKKIPEENRSSVIAKLNLPHYRWKEKINQNILELLPAEDKKKTEWQKLNIKILDLAENILKAFLTNDINQFKQSLNYLSEDKLKTALCAKITWNDKETTLFNHVFCGTNYKSGVAKEINTLIKKLNYTDSLKTVFTNLDLLKFIMSPKNSVHINNLKMIIPNICLDSLKNINQEWWREILQCWEKDEKIPKGNKHIAGCAVSLLEKNILNTDVYKDDIEEFTQYEIPKILLCGIFFPTSKDKELCNGRNELLKCMYWEDDITYELIKIESKDKLQFFKNYIDILLCKGFSYHKDNKDLKKFRLFCGSRERLQEILKNLFLRYPIKHIDDLTFLNNVWIYMKEKFEENILQYKSESKTFFGLFKPTLLESYNFFKTVRNHAVSKFDALKKTILNNTTKDEGKIQEEVKNLITTAISLELFNEHLLLNLGTPTNTVMRIKPNI